MPARSESPPAVPPLDLPCPTQGEEGHAAAVPKLLGTATAHKGGDEEEGKAGKYSTISTGSAGKEDTEEEVPAGWAATNSSKVRGSDYTDDSSNSRPRSKQVSKSSIGSPVSVVARGASKASVVSTRLVDAGRREFCCHGMSWALIAETFTTPVNTEAESETMGCVVQAEVRGPPPGSDASFKSMACRFAKFCCTELQYFPLPLLFTLIPTVLTSLVAGKWAIGGLVDPPWTCDPKESRIMIMYIERARKHPWWDELLSPLPKVLDIVGVAGVMYVICASWSWRTTGKIYRWCVMYFVIVLCTAWCAPIWMRSVLVGAGEIDCPFIESFSIWFSNVWLLFQIAMVVATFMCLSKATGNISFYLFKFLFVIVFVFYVYVLRVLAIPLDDQVDMTSDLMRVLLIILNTVSLEVVCMPWMRMIARASQGNHWSTSFLFPCFFVVLKASFGRMVVVKIQRLEFVVLVMVINGVGEYLLRVNMKMRDEFVYRRLFGRLVDNPLAQLANDRSKNIRAHGFLFESLCQHVFTINGIVLVLLFDYSGAGDTNPNLIKLLPKLAIQVLSEWVVDFSAMLTLKKVYGYDIMAKAVGRSWKWSLIFCPLVLFGSSFTMTQEAAVYCRTPSGPEYEQYNLTSTWMSCTRLWALDDLLNTTQL